MRPRRQHLRRVRAAEQREALGVGAVALGSGAFGVHAAALQTVPARAHRRMSPTTSLCFCVDQEDEEAMAQ